MAEDRGLLHQLGIDQQTGVWLIMLTILLGVSYWFKSSLEGLDVISKSSEPKPVIVIYDAHAQVYGRDRLLKYDLVTSGATNFSHQAGTHFKDVDIELYDEGKMIWSGHSDTAKLSDNMQQVDFAENVSIVQYGRKNGLSIYTDNLSYDNDSAVLSGNKSVRIQNGNSIFTGNAVRFDTRSEKFSLLNGVTGYYE